MNIARLALSTLALKAGVFESSTKDPLGLQKRLLLEYLGRNKNTEYGKKFNFSQIKSIQDYQKAVPISDCETMRPLLERMARGEKNILTVDDPIFFGATSGTTNKPKMIPVTKFSQDKKAELMGLWAYYISRDHPKILDGKVLAIISPVKEGVTESGLVFGAESGHAYKNLPSVIRHIYAIPDEVLDIEDFEARYYCILRIGMGEDVTTIATLNPSTIIILCRKIAAWQNDIIEDIGRGTLKKDLDIPSGVRMAIEKHLKPNPKRAVELKNILKERGELLPKYFWPHLELVECWKGGTVKLYLKELPQYLGDIPVRDMGCLSTEARSSIPMSDEGAGGVLAIDTNFYEFIPRSDADKPNPRTLLCDELEKGKEYLLVVTTPGGLYRYNIDDLVAVDGFFNKTPVIEFLQKGRNAVSLAGEKLYESQVSEAINIVVEKYGVRLALFTAAVQMEMPPRYVFLVEFDGDASSLPKRDFLSAVEDEFCRQNREYDFVRKSGLLNSPVLKVIKKGGFEKYRAKKIKLGAHDTQFKAPELTSDPDFQNNFEIEEEVRID